MTSSTCIVIPAAGRGSRFLGDGHKLVQQVNGHAVLEHTLRHAKASGLPVLLVTTAPIAAQAATWAVPHRVVVLPEVGSGTADDAPPGMGTSIAAGVAASPEAAGWLILPGDMPRVRPETLRAVAERLSQHPIVQAWHQGRRGHPVAFTAPLRAELTALAGDEGARSIVAKHGAFACDVDDPGILVDVDTAGDLARLRGA